MHKDEDNYITNNGIYNDIAYGAKNYDKITAYINDKVYYTLG